MEIEITGTADILFHRYNPEAVEEKSKAKKGSESKKTDNVESYVYRDRDGKICIPGSYLRQAVVGAAKFRQDPRSPRKSAMDLYKAGVVALTDLAPIISVTGETTKDGWDYMDQQGVQVQRSRVTRHRPAFFKGWKCTLQLAVLVPEYISPSDLNDVLIDAGRLIGLADYRPTYGRFQITRFEVCKDGQ